MRLKPFGSTEDIDTTVDLSQAFELDLHVVPLVSFGQSCYNTSLRLNTVGDFTDEADARASLPGAERLDG